MAHKHKWRRAPKDKFLDCGLSVQSRDGWSSRMSESECGEARCKKHKPKAEKKPVAKKDAKKAKSRKSRAK